MVANGDVDSVGDTCNEDFGGAHRVDRQVFGLFHTHIHEEHPGHLFSDLIQLLVWGDGFRIRVVLVQSPLVFQQIAEHINHTVDVLTRHFDVSFDLAKAFGQVNGKVRRCEFVDFVDPCLQGLRVHWAGRDDRILRTGHQK